MDSKKINNLSKRQQITASSKTVFLWVAGASIIASFSLVVAYFLLKQMIFNQKVLNAKIETSNNLQLDLHTIDPLKDSIHVLLANPALNSVKTSADANNLQVVFDALPTSYDSANFGASLQNVLLNGTVASIENLSVVAPDDQDAASGSASSPAAGGAQPMPFTLTVTGSADQIRTALENMEQSIRPIKITSLAITAGTPLTARISGETYYDPPVELKLQDKVIKP